MKFIEKYSRIRFKNSLNTYEFHDYSSDPFLSVREGSSQAGSGGWTGYEQTQTRFNRTIFGGEDASGINLTSGDDKRRNEEANHLFLYL